MSISFLENEVTQLFGEGVTCKIVKVIDDIFDDIYKIKFILETNEEIYIMKIDENRTLTKGVYSHKISSDYDIAPKIIKCDYCNCKEGNTILIIENYLDGWCEPLGGYLDRFKIKSKDDIVNIFEIVLNVYKTIFFMNFVLGIYHNNLTPENIILDTTTLKCKFINFIDDYDDGTSIIYNTIRDIESFTKFFREDFVNDGIVGGDLDLRHHTFSLINNIICSNMVEVANIIETYNYNIKKEDIEKIFNHINKLINEYFLKTQFKLFQKMIF